MQKTFGEWLKAKRGRRGEPGFITQEDLANRMGVDRTFIVQLEKKDRPVPTYPTRQRIHEALGTTEQELMDLGLVRVTDAVVSVPVTGTRSKSDTADGITETSSNRNANDSSTVFTENDDSYEPWLSSSERLLKNLTPKDFMALDMIAMLMSWSRKHDLKAAFVLSRLPGEDEWILSSETGGFDPDRWQPIPDDFETRSILHRQQVFDLFNRQLERSKKVPQRGAEDPVNDEGGEVEGEADS